MNIRLERNFFLSLSFLFPFLFFFFLYNCNLGCNLGCVKFPSPRCLSCDVVCCNAFQCHQQSLKRLKTKPSMRVIVFNWLVKPAVNRLQTSHGPRMEINWSKLWIFKTARERMLGHMYAKLKTKWHKWQQVHRLQCSVSLKDLFLYDFNAVPWKESVKWM